jgi:SAM-dependent methyltransferase
MEVLSGTYSASAEFERAYVRPRAGRTLIAGARVYEGREDRRALYEHAEGWDALPGAGVDRVIDMETDVPMGEQFAHVECISVLEHARRPWLLAQNIEQVLRVGGTLHVTVPFVWRVHAYPDDFWRFTASGLCALFSCIEWVRVMYASTDLTDSIKARAISVHEYPYLARTQVCAFGVRQ